MFARTYVNTDTHDQLNVVGVKGYNITVYIYVINTTPSITTCTVEPLSQTPLGQESVSNTVVSFKCIFSIIMYLGQQRFS